MNNIPHIDIREKEVWVTGQNISVKASNVSEVSSGEPHPEIYSRLREIGIVEDSFVHGFRGTEEYFVFSRCKSGS